MKNHCRRIGFARAAAFVFVMVAPLSASAATYYVATTGSDTAAGTEAAPFASWARAQTAVAAGDTVYFRGGTYKYTDATSTCTSTTATVDSIVLSKSGTSGNPINYWAYPGETPVFDFSGLTDTTKYSCRQVGIRVEADWLYLKGFEVKGVLQLNMDNHESWCVYVIGGSNNIFELMNAHHNMGPGFFVITGGNNTFLNCDSHENEDTLTSNGDGQSADGFGCHPNQQGDTGNIFKGCRAWWNSDDAWDFINSQEACTVEDSWAWYSGYKPDALTGGAPVALAAGNGNGFKGGGYGDPQTGVPSPTPQHIIQFDAAFYVKANGFYANHEIVNPFFYNNTAFNNGTDFDMLGLDGTTVTSVGTLKNNAAYSNDGHELTTDFTNGGPIVDEFNSWDTSLNLKLTNADFMSVAFSPPASCPEVYTPGGTACCAPTDTTCFAGMAGARQADGSLPVTPFLRPSATSQLIDKGTNLGFPFSGTAPDLGCFDHGLGLVLLYDAGTNEASTGGAEAGGGDASVDATVDAGSEAGKATDSGVDAIASGGDAMADSSSGNDSASGDTDGSANDSGGGVDGSSTSADSGGTPVGDSGTTSGDSGGTMVADSGGTAVGDSGTSLSGDGSPIGSGADGSSINDAAGNSAGCSCRVTRRGSAGNGGALVLGLGLLVAARRRRADRAARSTV
jgi:MYXO-CTERM domain-containing protein